MNLTPDQTDRARGVLLAAACGDALGAGYEFGSAPLGDHPEMIGGGLGDFAPGEWTDDTSQLYAIALVAATGADLRTSGALDDVAAGFLRWYAGNPPDVGIQTSQILAAAAPTPSAAAMTRHAADHFARTGRAGGNGSLMRTAPVALAHLDDPRALVEAATAVSALTHADPQAMQACALWCLAIRESVLSGRLPDLRSLVAYLPESSHTFWNERITEAEASEPGRFRPNGWAVAALQAAWSAIVRTPVPDAGPAGHLVAALETAIRIGDDTDTVAAIAGALLGARWGASAVPGEWRRIVHGWPGDTADGLVRLAHLAVDPSER
ncbi:ADP-ribosylglycohydrolase family protein [Myceligenerans crystallogenes]|uniref:ADP-ribosylglycohydrolase n=1 Tax=Myceligenerans crystallogenes TaxID=316335 RepID=A0ABN2NJH0_9MICO